MTIATLPSVPDTADRSFTINRLFGVTLDLSAVASAVDPRWQLRLLRAVDEIDAAIGSLRNDALVAFAPASCSQSQYARSGTFSHRAHASET